MSLILVCYNFLYAKAKDYITIKHLDIAYFI